MKIVVHGLTAKEGGWSVEASGANPAIAADPVAASTEWTPLKPGGASFKTHHLIESSPDRLEYKASVAAKITYSLFMIVGVGLLIGTWMLYRNMPVSLSVGAIIGTFLPGALFSVIGAFMLRRGSMPIVFDRRLKAFWRGRTAPDHLFNPGELKNYAPFDQIHAVQIVAEHIRTKSSFYLSYEMNLVLADGKRLHVIDHSRIGQIRADAARLAAFAGGKPVWDVAG